MTFERIIKMSKCWCCVCMKLSECVCVYRDWLAKAKNKDDRCIPSSLLFPLSSVEDGRIRWRLGSSGCLLVRSVPDVLACVFACLCVCVCVCVHEVWLRCVSPWIANMNRRRCDGILSLHLSIS